MGAINSATTAAATTDAAATTTANPAATTADPAATIGDAGIADTTTTTTTTTDAAATIGDAVTADATTTTDAAATTNAANANPAVPTDAAATTDDAAATTNAANANPAVPTDAAATTADAAATTADAAATTADAAATTADAAATTNAANANPAVPTDAAATTADAAATTADAAATTADAAATTADPAATVTNTAATPRLVLTNLNPDTKKVCPDVNLGDLTPTGFTTVSKSDRKAFTKDTTVLVGSVVINGTQTIVFVELPNMYVDDERFEAGNNKLGPALKLWIGYAAALHGLSRAVFLDRVRRAVRSTNPRIEPYFGNLASMIIVFACFGNLSFKLAWSVFEADTYFVPFNDEFVPEGQYLQNAAALATAIGVALVTSDAGLLARVVRDATEEGEFQPANLPMMTLHNMALGGEMTANRLAIVQEVKLGGCFDEDMLARMVLCD